MTRFSVHKGRPEPAAHGTWPGRYAGRAAAASSGRGVARPGSEAARNIASARSTRSSGSRRLRDLRDPRRGRRGDNERERSTHRDENLIRGRVVLRARSLVRRRWRAPLGALQRGDRRRVRAAGRRGLRAGGLTAGGDRHRARLGLGRDRRSPTARRAHHRLSAEAPAQGSGSPGGSTPGLPPCQSAYDLAPLLPAL